MLLCMYLKWENSLFKFTVDVMIFIHFIVNIFMSLEKEPLSPYQIDGMNLLHFWLLCKQIQHALWTENQKFWDMDRSQQHATEIFLNIYWHTAFQNLSISMFFYFYFLVHIPFATSNKQQSSNSFPRGDFSA